MHLKKEVMLYNGIIAKAHRVTEYSFDSQSPQRACVLGSWPTEGDMLSGAQPTILTRFDFRSSDADVLASAYAAIITEPGWAEAELVS